MALILVPHPKWSNTGFWFSHHEIRLVWCLPTVGNGVEPSSFRFPSKLHNRKEREHLVPQLVKNSPAVQETPVGFLGWEVPRRRDRLPTPVFLGFPGSSDGKESACNAEDLVLMSGLGRSPEGGHGNPLQYSCLETTHGQRSLVGYSPWDCRVRHDWATKHTQHNVLFVSMSFLL